LNDQLTKKIFLIAGIIAVLGVASSSVVISSPVSAQTLAEKDSSSAEKIVVFIEVDNPKTKNQLKALPDVVLRHDFPNGFSATIPAPAREGIEKRPGVTVHDVPIHRLLVPSDQTPYGIEQIYNDSTITSTSGGEGVVIGHLDTGVDKDHPDLKNRIVGCNDATKRGISGGCNDNNGHGTHTAGTAVADGGDGTGIFGVAPGANLWAVKVCKALCFTDDIAAAIDFLGAQASVKIITMSLGGDTESRLIRDAIDRNPHILYVAAAGNDGPSAGSIDYPGANPNVIAVAAIDSTKTVASFSSRGIDDGDDSVISEREVEFSAAGVRVESTWKLEDEGYNTISGTSMATPHIAGLAAKEWRGTAIDTRTYLRTHAEDIIDGLGAGTGYDIASGYGLSHVTPVQTTPDFSISADPTSLTISTSSSGVSTITIDALNDFTGTVNLASSSTISASLNPTSVELTVTTTSATSTLTVTSGTSLGDFSVEVTGTSGDLSHSTTVTVKVASEPSAPQNLAATAGDSSVKLTWLAPTSDGNSAITNYKIYSGTTSGGETFLAQVGNVLEYTDTGLTNDIEYFYYVTAINIIGESDPSIEVSATPTASVTGAVTVSIIDPSEIGKGTTIGVMITGSGFQSGASVTFENGCGPSPSASNVSVSGDGKSITADITTKSGGPNKNCTFDVRVTNTDASTGVLLDGFTVLPS